VTFESGSRLERIEESAFHGSGLKSIVIPSSVVVLGRSSFYLCKSLESVTFESGSRLERIEESAFHGSGLQSIVIPGRVTFVDGSAFIDLSLIAASPDDMQFRLCECLLESFDGSVIYRYFGSCHSIVIPSSVIVLGKGSFARCESLEWVTFESGSRLERIEENAFYGSGLKSIEIPGSVTFLSGSAFVVIFLNSICVCQDNMQFRVRECFLEAFDGSVIYRCFGYCHSIVIPSSVVVLGKSSFCECESLESVTFESDSRLERIGNSAFRCSGLKSILIPSSVVVLGKGSFCECKSLETVKFVSGSRLERIEECAFRLCELKSIEIPSSVVVFGKEWCCSCWSLESVTFESGSRMDRIDESAFQGSGLRSFLIPSSVVVLGRGSFCRCESLEAVAFESDSRLERIEECGLQSIAIPPSAVVVRDFIFPECE
jgi:hypothetical protein